jgi:chromosome segregation protein
MRLKSIKLSGFKSFVDPTNVKFPSNLCAVVGPNGCGKSNVIDAVRWVMGESSAKNLRGDSMSDVIFNGSGGRKPVGQASVELIFDNTDQRIVGEYASYNEIGIRRKVTRDGQSNYYLNGNKCRRRDITDIFLGTGLGPRSYAIIEQGMISRLIESKPDELRIYIEEAAGISKYKERRRETESRMQRTMENLERLTDIRDELGRQLSRLERQAKAAEKYADYKQEERQLTIESLALKWRAYSHDAGDLKAIIGGLDVDKERILAERSHCDATIEKLRAEFVDQSDAFNEIQARFYKVGGEVTRIEQAIEHARQRAQDIDRDLQQTELNYRETHQQLNADKQKVIGWQAEFDELTPALTVAIGRQAESSEALKEAELMLSDWQQRWDEFNQHSATPRQQAEVQQSRIQHLEQLMRRLGERQQRLQEEAQSFHASPAEDERSAIQQLLDAAERVRTVIDSEQQENRKAIENLREQEKQADSDYNQIRSAQQTAQGRQASLQALQQAAMGDDAEQRWLSDVGLDKMPRLAEQITPIKGWEVAVETVLGSYLQAISVTDMPGAIDLMQGFSKGELLFVDGMPVSPEKEENHGTKGRWLSDFVDGNSALNLLANIYAVESLPEALDLQSKLSPRESVVTIDGIWLGVNWARVARDKDATAGVLQRKQELESIEGQLQRFAETIGELEQRRAGHSQTMNALESNRQALAMRIEEQQQNYADLRSKLSGFDVQIEQFKARKQRAETELVEVNAQMLLEQQHLANARVLLQESIEKMEADTATKESFVSERDKVRKIVDQARIDAQKNRENAQQLTLREGSLSIQLTSVNEAIVRLELQLKRLEERREELRLAFEVKEDPTEDYQQQLAQQLASRLTIEAELGEARKQVEAIEYQSREEQKRRGAFEIELQKVQVQLEEKRLSAQEISTLSGALEAQIVSHKGVLEDLLDVLVDDADIVDWEEQLQLIANRVQRLGPINLAAIDEYAIESERKDYLDKQNSELEDALDTLKTAIQKIDRETRTRFKETFELVNTHIQYLFPKLFGGGHAYLEMTGEDLLNTGVTLMARPPGKKNASIHLLSGGEKALTAIAMVFAIFKLNPAPFCMLDEVDAPLDDANVARYAAMVKEMSSEVQFIFITHNKISMEAANQLMGVTMHEAGVSRLVSVDVDQAAELADA